MKGQLGIMVSSRMIGSELKQNSSGLYKCFSALFAIYIIIYPLDQPVVFRAVMFCIYAVVLLFSFQYCRMPVNKTVILLQFLCISIVLMEVVYHDINVNIDSLQTLLCFLSQIMLLGAFDTFEFDEDTHNFTRKVALLASVVLSVYSFFPFAYYYRGTTITCIYLTLNFDNSNFTGIVLFLLFTVLWIERIRVKGRVRLFFYYGIMGYLAYLVVRSNSRTCLGAIILIVVYSLFFARRKIPTFVLLVTELIPFVFVPIYSTMSILGENSIMIMGKRLFSGRQDIYERYLSWMVTMPQILFGNMKKIFFLNTGNGPLAIFCATGVVGCLVFYLLYITQILKLNRNSNTPTSNSAIIALLAIALHTCAESSMVLGGIAALYFHFTLFCLAKSR